MINLDYKDGRSLHEQIESGFRELIINGVLTENEQLPSVRELSVSLTVNPNTVQKAYKQLEIDGFIYSIKGKGNFVAPVSKAENEERSQELFSNLEAVVRELIYLGNTTGKIIEFIGEIQAKGVNEDD